MTIKLAISPVLSETIAAHSTSTNILDEIDPDLYY